MTIKPLFLLYMYPLLAPFAIAGGNTTDEQVQYFFQLSSGYSRTLNTPDLKLQGGLSVSKAPVRWGYRFGAGIISKPYNHNILGAELALSQYTKNKWLFSPLSSSVVQDLMGVELLGSIQRHLTQKITLTLKGGAVFIRQKLTASGVFNTPSRFRFNYLGSSTKVKPLIALELSHYMTSTTLVFINFNHIFAQHPDDANALPGPAPTLFPNQSWQNPASINNLMVGLTVLY